MNNIGNPELIQQQFELSEMLTDAIDELAHRGDMLAQAQYSYQRQKRETAYRLKDSGMPVTMIQQVLKGEPEVAILMRERDIAEARYKAALETINVLKLQIRTHDNQIQREWGNGGS